MRARDRWLATALSAVLASPVLSVLPATAQDESFDFEPLLMPFPAGVGIILPGSTLHTGGDGHALDLCAGDGCAGGQVGDRVLAPTDLTYDDLSISTNGDDTDAPDFHFFEIASNADDRLCMSLGHFDLSEPGTLVDGKRTYQQGELLGTLLDFPTVPHVHMGLYTVPAQSRCNSKQRYLDPDTGELRGRTAVAFEGEFAIEGLAVDGSVGSAVTSTNGSSDPSGIRTAQWIEPVEGATVGPRLTLAAWPTPVLMNGSLTDDPTSARVDFHTTIDGEKVEACSANRADETGVWACEANLRDLGANAGELQFTFDVTRTDGGVAPAPGGIRTVVLSAASPPTVAWVKKGTTNDASHVPFGEPVTLVTRFHGDVDVAEVHFTAYYPDWPDAKDARKIAGFDPKETWRTLKVCRPNTKGCSWEGDEQAATVSYTWDPTAGEKKRSIDGVPKADPAISLKSTKCVPVTLGIDAIDASGAITSAPGGKIAQRCDAQAEGLARTVYLDPLAPPAAPGNVRVQHIPQRCDPLVQNRSENGGCCDGDYFACFWDYRVTWSPVPDVTGYRVYARLITARYKGGFNCVTKAEGRTSLIATTPVGRTQLRRRFQWDRDSGPGRPTETTGPWAVGAIYYVTAVNNAGESQPATSRRVMFKETGQCS